MPVPQRAPKLSEHQYAQLRECGFAVLSVEPDSRIEIQESECFVIIGNPTRVETRGVSPCMGLILVSKVPQLIVGFHALGQGEKDPPEFTNFLSVLSILNIRPFKAEIALAGLCGDGLHDQDGLRALKRSILKRLKELEFRANVRFSWPSRMEHCSLSYSRITDRLMIELSEGSGSED